MATILENIIKKYKNIENIRKRNCWCFSLFSHIIDFLVETLGCHTNNFTNWSWQNK